MDNFISIILSLIIAISVTWYFTKKQMKKNEITHFSINSYDVGKGLHNVFPNFRLTYEGEEMSNKVIVLKGGFINSGRNDIIGLKNDSDLKIFLPEGCRLKEIQIKRLCSDLKVKAYCNKETLNVMNFGIDEKFMSGESFEYLAIIEATEDVRDLLQKIEFKHRIPNTSKIRNEDIVGQKSQLGILNMPYLFKEKSFGILSLIAMILFCFFSLSLLFQQKVPYFIYENGTDKELSVYITPQSQIYVSGNELFPFLDYKAITEDEINKKYYLGLKTDYSWNSDNSILGIMMAVMSLIYLFFAFFSFYLWNRKKRIYQLLEQYEKESL